LVTAASRAVELIALSLILFVVGFVCGYGVRGFIARRRRQAARKIFYEEYPEFGPP
jgi:hypothetical protein